MKRALIAIMLMSILLLNAAGIIASAQTAVNQKAFPKIHVDVSAILAQLGLPYSNDDIPEKLLLQIMRSYDPVQGILKPDGDLYYTITPDSKPAPKNLIGSDTVVPYDSVTINSFSSSTVEKSSFMSPNYLEEGKAASVFGIWDYPGDHNDLSGLDYSYNDITYYISYSGQYNFWHFFSNDQVTNYNVWAWITWACATYSNVDVYWLGHGTIVNGYAAYVPYDAIWDWGWIWGIDENNLYLAYDFYSGGYDYSTLRVGMGDFCYGGQFSDMFLSPGGSVQHDRAFNGPWLESNVAYSNAFAPTWDYWWVPNYCNSYDAIQSARVAAAQWIQPGQMGYTYTDTGNAVWC